MVLTVIPVNAGIQPGKHLGSRLRNDKTAQAR